MILLWDTKHQLHFNYYFNFEINFWHVITQSILKISRLYFHRMFLHYMRVLYVENSKSQKTTMTLVFIMTVDITIYSTPWHTAAPIKYNHFTINNHWPLFTHNSTAQCVSRTCCSTPGQTCFLLLQWSALSSRDGDLSHLVQGR